MLFIPLWGRGGLCGGLEVFVSGGKGLRFFVIFCRFLLFLLDFANVGLSGLGCSVNGVTIHSKCPCEWEWGVRWGQYGKFKGSREGPAALAG